MSNLERGDKINEPYKKKENPKKLTKLKSLSQPSNKLWQKI